MTVETPTAVPRSKSRGWGRRILLSVVGLVLLIWAAPIIATWTPLVSWACARAANYINGSVTVGSASLGWFSPIVLYNVELRDPDGQVIAQVGKIEGDRTLFMLLVDHDDLGTFRFEKPKIDVTFAGNGSNLEKVLAKSLPGPPGAKPGDAQAGSTMPQVRLEIVDATVKIHDADTKESWQVQALSLNAMLFNDDGQSVQINLQGSLNDGAEAGTLKAELNLHRSPDQNIKATVKGRFNSLPLALTNVLVRRYQPGTRLAGSLQGNGNLTVAINAGKPHVELTGEMIANHVTVATPLLKDTLQVERIQAPCTLRLDDQQLIVQHAELNTDFSTVTAHGSLDLGAAWLAVFDKPDFDLTLEANLATLAQRLPKTLHLHQDLKLTDGQLNVRCTSQLKDGAIVWQGNLHTSDIRGVKGEQAIAWTEPITLSFQVRDLHKGVPLIDELRCSAQFLHVEGSTTADQFTLTAEADLQRLAEPLGQFIDLDGVKLAGKANGAIQVRRIEQDRFQMQGDAEFRQMNLTWLTREPWQEGVVSAKFAATGRIGPAGQQRIDASDVTLILANDVVIVKLTEPIVDLARGPWSTFDVRVDGELARWQKRARSWTTCLDDWQLAGQGNLHLQLRTSPQAVECLAADLQATGLRVTGPSLWIQEPTLCVQTSGRWDGTTGSLELTGTKVTCPAVEITADQMSLHLATMTLQGAASLIGDVARLRQWTHDPSAKPAEPLQGTLAGRIDLNLTRARFSAEFNLTLKDLLYGATTKPTWREPEVKCVGRGTYDRSLDVLQFEKLNLASATLSADAVGTIANLTTTRDIDLGGNLAYDLEQLEAHLRPLLGKDAKIAGKDTRAFTLAGPLYPKSKANVVAVSITGPPFAPPALSLRELKGAAGMHWKSLHALGCDVGPAELKAVVQQGWLQLYPIETTFNGGKLRMQPNLKLEPGPMEMILLAGPVIDKAAITPQMCAGALGFAMPVLANVTEAEGSISVSLEGGRIPLSAPLASGGGEVKGTITLHQANVGPNAIVRELSNLLKIAPPTSIVKECQVPFHMVNGQVHHSNLEIAFADFTLKSSGTVGLDGSLALVVEMPIPPRIAAALKLTPAQASQTIRIPIGGTLEHPRADGKAIEALTSVLGRSILENQLNRLLR